MPNAARTHSQRLPRPHRPSAAARGYGARWRKVRRRYLNRHPLCVKCKEEGKVVAANVVDHIVPHRGDPVLMWDEAGFQSLCRHHHDQKTANEDGGFGR